MPKNTPSHQFKIKRSNLLQLIIAVVALIVLVPQFSQFAQSRHHLLNASPYWLTIGLLATGLTVLFAGLVYIVLVKDLPLKRTLLIQLATYFTNRLLPSGLGGLGFNTLYIAKQTKRPKSEAGVYATANNLIGFVAFSLVMLTVSLVTRNNISYNLPADKILFASGGLIILIAILLSITKLRAKITLLLGHVFRATLEISRQPLRLLASLIFSICITICYAVILWASTKSVGLNISAFELFIAFLIGNTALSISPTPGGIGAVEAATTAVLISFGANSSLALAATLIFRILSYWLPIIPGYIAFRVATKKSYV